MVNLAGANAGTPAALGGDFKSEPRTQSVEVRGRHNVDLGLQLPSLFGGEYFYDNISVNPFIFVPMREGLQLTSLRAWAHNVPRYYEQNFGNPVSHPNSNDYAGFVQDTFG